MMAQLYKCLVWVFVVCFCLLNSCTSDTPLRYEILHIEGVSWACNVTTTYAHFGAAYEFEDNWEVRIPVSDGDLLYMWDENDLELYYRYHAEDGNHMVVSRDTLQPHLVYVNDALSQVELREVQSYQTLFNELSAQTDHKRAPLLICDTITREMIHQLKEFQALLDGSGIAIETEISSELFNEFFSVCKPGWMILHTLPFSLDTNPVPVLNSTETLWITGDLPEFLPLVQQCKNLKSLIIGEWEPDAAVSVSMSGLKKLHTLTLAECGILDMSDIEFPYGLERLHFVACDTLTNISAISQIPQLKSLGLAGNYDVKFLESFSGLKELNRISLPASTSQEDLEFIAERALSLEVIELLECPEVKEVSPLKELENLRILILFADTLLPEQIGILQQLELILLNKELFENSPELIAELRAQLPDTQIVPGSGLCLGSGWLLLILPLLIVSRLLFKKR